MAMMGAPVGASIGAMIQDSVGLRGEVCAVLDNEDRAHAFYCPAASGEAECDCGKIVTSITHNIITNAGDTYYAERGAAETPTNTFSQMTVATAGTFGSKTSDAGDVTTVPTGGTQNIDASYPQTNDSDANNPGTTGTDIVTWKRTYTTSQANGTLVGVVINVSGATFGSGSDPLLMSAAISVTKTSGQSLSIYVNHTFTGA